MKSFVIHSLHDLQSLADKLYQSGVKCLALAGPLGVGKTQFVKEFVTVLGGDKNSVQSPSYTYLNRYSTPVGRLLHIDMYRLTDKKTAFERGIFEAIDEHDMIMIEWPRREEEYRDESRTKLEFSFGTNEERIITLDNNN